MEKTGITHSDDVFKKKMCIRKCKIILNSVGLLETEPLRWDLSDLHIHAYSKTNQGKNSKKE